MKSDSQRVRLSFNSPVTLTFVALCFIVMILDQLSNGKSTEVFFSIYRASLSSPLTYVRFFGHIVGHADWDHLFGNIMMLLVIGPLLEEKYGSSNILFVILSTALVTGIIHFMLFPNVMLLGASGVVFAFLLLASFTSVDNGKIPITFILVAIIYIGSQIYEGLFIDDHVSNLTHIIGGILGAGFGYIMNKYKMNRY